MSEARTPPYSAPVGIRSRGVPTGLGLTLLITSRAVSVEVRAVYPDTYHTKQLDPMQDANVQHNTAKGMQVRGRFNEPR